MGNARALGLFLLFTLVAVSKIMQAAESSDLLFQVKLNGELLAKSTQEFTLFVEISSVDEIGEIKVTLRGSEDVSFDHVTTWYDTLRGVNEYTYAIKTIVPANDTSQIFCDVESTHAVGSRPYPPRVGGRCAAVIMSDDSLAFYEPCAKLKKLVDDRKSAAVLEAERTFGEKGHGSNILCAVNHVEKNRREGTVRLEQFTYSRNPLPSPELEVTLTPVNGVQVHGDARWTEDFTDYVWWKPVMRSPAHTRWYDITIPPRDTSGLILSFLCGDYKQEAKLTFVTTGDTLEMWLGERLAGMPITPSPRTDSSLVEEYPYVYGDQTRTKPQSGESIQRDPNDPALIQLKKDNSRWRDLNRLKEREKKPCEKEYERVLVGGETWERRQGEFEYHRIYLREGEDSSTTISKEIEALAKKLQIGIPVHIVVRMGPEPEYEYINGIMEGSPEMERPGYYHQIVTQSVTDRLDSLGIPWAEYPSYPDGD